MKLVETVTIRQDPDEPWLQIHLYTVAGKKFYIRMEAETAAPSMPLRIYVDSFKEARAAVEKLLYIQRSTFRKALGKPPDLPEDMKEMEKEIPAFLHYLLTNSFVGQN